MKKLILGLGIAIFAVACGNVEEKAPVAADSTAVVVDSLAVADTVVVDSLAK